MDWFLYDNGLRRERVEQRAFESSAKAQDIAEMRLIFFVLQDKIFNQ